MLFIILLVITICAIGVSLYLKNKMKTQFTQNKVEVDETLALEKAAILASKKIEEANLKVKEQEAKFQERLEMDKKRIDERKKYVDDKENVLENRIKMLNEQSDTLRSKESFISNEAKKITDFKVQFLEKLLSVVKKSKEEVSSELQNNWRNSLEKYLTKRIKESEQTIENNKDEILEEYLYEVTPQISVDFYSEPTNSLAEYRDEKEKNKVLGINDEIKEILEELTESQIIDEENGRILKVSCLDPIRREVASRVLHDLFGTKQRISKDLVKKLVNDEKNFLAKDLIVTGEKVSEMLGFSDLPKKIKLAVGKCKYRFSYGQNLLKHSIEMAQLGETLADMFGADTRITKLACFLHDIGKVEAEEGEQHHHVSAEIVKEYNPSPILYNAIISHHYDVDSEYIESDIVRIADAISGSRPGARRYSAEEYFEKIKALEEIAGHPEGVKQAFAIQAGREVRVLVDPFKISDEGTIAIAKSIAGEIEDKLSYPGVVKVQVIRETIATDKTKDAKED